MSSETEQRFRQRTQNVQTRVTSIASMTIPSDQQADWVRRKLEVLQYVIGQLNESVKAANSIEEVNAGLTSGETRTFFDERMEKFNINYDAEHDNQENKDNFEAACQEVVRSRRKYCGAGKISRRTTTIMLCENKGEGMTE